MAAIGKLQSDLLADNEEARNGDWLRAASLRSSTNREDNDNLGVLARRLSKAPFLGIFGEVNLAELDGEMDANDFYRALGVPPPKPEAVWVVYELSLIHI